MSCDSHCSAALPHEALAWSAVCDCAYFLAMITYFFESGGNKLNKIRVFTDTYSDSLTILI